MSKRKIRRCLSEDLSQTELPPISYSVRQALREQHRSSDCVREVSAGRLSRLSPVKCVFAAVLLLSVAAAPLVVVLRYRETVTEVSVSESRPKESAPVSSSVPQPVSVNASETVPDELSQKEICKEACLSQRTEEELGTLLQSYTVDSAVYEDEEYLYQFNPQGKLIELYAFLPPEDTNPPADSQQVEDLSREIIHDYFPDWLECFDQRIVTEEKDCLPAFTVTLSRKGSGLETESLTMFFTPSGALIRAMASGLAEDVGTISRKEAIRLVLEDIRKGTDGVSAFLDTDVEIVIKNRVYDETPYYGISVTGVPTGDEYSVTFYYTVDPATGETERKDYGLSLRDHV